MSNFKLNEKNSGYALLLTGTIDPSVFGNPNTVLTDVDQRLGQYQETIERYILESPFTKIVFAENSGYLFPSHEMQLLANNHGKEFEFLFVKIDKEIKSKSFGEADLIDKAMKQSRLLQDESVIYKMTGRVFLLNSHEILRKNVSEKSEFITNHFRHECQTVFFKILRTDYETAWLPILDRIDERSGRNIEKSVYQVFQEKKISYTCFRVYPAFHGIVGGTNTPYDRTHKTLIAKNFMLRLGLFQPIELNMAQKLLQKIISRVYPDLLW